MFSVYCIFFFTFMFGDSEWPVYHVGLDGLVVNATSDEPFGVIDGVCRIQGQLVLGSLADEPSSSLREGDAGRGGPVAVVTQEHISLFYQFLFIFRQYNPI